MLLMAGAIKGGTLSPENALGIGTFSGLALLFSSVYQGKMCSVRDSSGREAACYFG